MAPWVGVGGLVLLCLLPHLLIFSVGDDDMLSTLWFIADYNTFAGQDYTSICTCVVAGTVATDLVCLGEVSDVIPLGEWRRVAWVGPSWRRSLFGTFRLGWRV